MKELYCLKDKKKTPNAEPSGFQKDIRGNLQFFCHCAICGRKKVSYVKNDQTGSGVKKRKTKKKTKN